MELKVDFNKEKIKENHGLGQGKKAQQYVDSEVLRLMAAYTPHKTGDMERSATRGTIIGSGIIKYTAPQARFQYYGKVMVDSVTGSTYSPKGGKKVLTDRNLTYNEAPKRGAFWFERMKADHMDGILKGIKKVVKGHK